MPSQENKNFTVLIEKVRSALEEGIPFAIYRKPGKTDVRAVFQKDKALHTNRDFKTKGFVFAPFDSRKDAVLIRADVFVTAPFHPVASSTVSPKTTNLDGKPKHLELVQKGIREIGRGTLKKVVLSRKLEIKVQSEPQDVFQRLLMNYHNAFCYLVHHPKMGTWCGATPETLVGIKNRDVRTMSLAATLPNVEDEIPNWGSKEKEEQLMVSEYIMTQLKGLTTSLKIGPVESVRAGNLWHLKSEVEAEMDENASVAEIVAALHPTPAVCGIPTLEAQKFILEHEGYDRSFYTGYLGELHVGGEQRISLYVNLRCMQMESGKASIYVGGGITSASDPKKEWTETQNKSRTLLDIL
nr:chorismate-binding protein [Allomuricauda sp.]